jgi:hypothetical protein
MAEIPVALIVKPFEREVNWEAQLAKIKYWNLPPIKGTSHFIQFAGFTLMSQAADWEQLEFWAKRAFRRLGALGVEYAGLYGGFFKLPEGVSRKQVTNQAIRYFNMLADYAEPNHVKLMLEPIADSHTLLPMYLEGVEFVKKEIAIPAVSQLPARG